MRSANATSNFFILQNLTTCFGPFGPSSGAETCIEVLKNKEVVSCVCGSHIYIYSFILYVYIVYVSNATGSIPQNKVYHHFQNISLWPERNRQMRKQRWQITIFKIKNQPSARNVIHLEGPIVFVAGLDIPRHLWNTNVQSQELTTGRYPEPVESPYAFKIHFNSILKLSFTSSFSKSCSQFRFCE
jgi:hypothetical protein